MNYPEGQIAIDNMGADNIRRLFVLSNLKVNIENHLITIVAWIIAAVFLCAAFVNGFSPKSLFGENLFFLSDAAKNNFDITYLVTAIGLIVTTLLGEKKAISFIQVIGKIYILISLIGFMRIGPYIYNEWIAIMNLMYGLILYAAGAVLKDYRHDLLVARIIFKQAYSGNYAIMDTIKKSNFEYSVQKRHNDATDNNYYRQDFFETDCIRGEFI